MYLMNILLTIGLILLISGITVLSICAVIASSKSEKSYASSPQNRNNKERRKNNPQCFPITCSDGTMVYFDRRIRPERRFA